MKRKIRNILLFIAALVAVDQIGGRTLDYLCDQLYAAHPTVDKTFYVANAIDADIVIIGASNANGSYIARQIADSTGMTCYNAAISGRFADYQCSLIHLMLRHHKPKYLLWEIGEFAFSDDFANIDYSGSIDIYPYYDEDEYVHDYINRKDQWQPLRMLSRLYRHNSKLSAYLSLTYNMNPDSLLGYEPRPTTGYKYPEYTEDNGNEGDYASTFSQARHDTLKHTIQYCQAQGVKVIVTSSPRYVNGKMRGSFMYNKMCSLTKECSCPYIEFLDEERFTKDNTMFYDAGHLNNRGAELYMTLFIPELKKHLK